MEDDYSIRLCHRDDRMDFLALHDLVFGGGFGEEWFHWKYEENPYWDQIPIFIAETNGEIAGARGLWPLQMGLNGKVYLALQPCDTMVHPDHRRKGLFTKMTKFGIDYFQKQASPKVLFNTPGSMSKPGYLKLGWDELGIPEYFRFSQLNLKNYNSSFHLRPLLNIGSIYLRARTKSPEQIDNRVELHDQPPVELLNKIYSNSDLNKFHVVKDQTFYNWRVSKLPGYFPKTIIGYNGDNPVFALILRDRGSGIAIHDCIWDNSISNSQLRGFLSDVIYRYSHKRIRYFGNQLPESLVSDYGFLDKRRFPTFTNRNFVVRPVDNESWNIEGKQLNNADNWMVSKLISDSPQ